MANDKWNAKIGSRQFWTEGWGSFAVAIAVALSIRWALMEAYVIPSASMLPTLLIHDHIFVNKIVYGVRVPFSESWLVKFNEPKRGDVIVFKYPINKSVFFIKRVVGLPGDKVTYESNKLYVNDKLAETQPASDHSDFDRVRDVDFSQEGEAAADWRDSKSQYVHLTEELPGGKKHSILMSKEARYGTSQTWNVPSNSLFVMGDNRDNSLDSRKWPIGRSFVPEEYILGRAMFVWLSCEDTLPVVTFLCNPLTLRWGRFFHAVD